LFLPRSVFCDADSLVVADSQNNRLLIWHSFPTSNGQPADVVLGQPDMISRTPNNGGISASSLSIPYYVFKANSKLFVSDTGNNRVLIWNTMPVSNGQAADIVLGQPNMTSSYQSGTSSSRLNYPIGIYSDSQTLFVADSENHRVLKWNTMPTSNGQSADIVLGQPDMTSNTPNNGGVSASSLFVPWGIYMDSNRNLLVSDSLNNRVLIYQNPTTNGTPAANVIGQPNFVSNTPNNGGVSQKSLFSPSGLYADSSGVYVADTLNHRTMYFPKMRKPKLETKMDTF
jgi:hypothetical protein